MLTLTLKGKDVRIEASRHELMRQMDACFRKHGMTDENDNDFFKESLALPCTAPEIGCYVETYGIDRLCDWTGMTADQIGKHPFLMPADLEAINKRVERHLNRCRHCLAVSWDYACFVNALMPRVLYIASDELEERVDRLQRQKREISSEEALALQQKFILRAYYPLVSIERMREKDKFDDEVEAIPCTKKRIGKLVDSCGPIWLGQIFTMSDTELKAEPNCRFRQPLAKRMERLHELSEHLKACRHCATIYEFEKKERELEESICKALKQESPATSGAS